MKKHLPKQVLLMFLRFFCEVSRQCRKVKQRLRRREVLCPAQCEVKRATHDKQALHDAKHHFTHEVRFSCRKARFVRKSGQTEQN